MATHPETIAAHLLSLFSELPCKVLTILLLRLCFTDLIAPTGADLDTAIRLQLRHSLTQLLRILLLDFQLEASPAKPPARSRDWRRKQKLRYHAILQNHMQE